MSTAGQCRTPSSFSRNELSCNSILIAIDLFPVSLPYKSVHTSVQSVSDCSGFVTDAAVALAQLIVKSTIVYSQICVYFSAREQCFVV